MKKQLRQKCSCGLSFRYPADFEEHKRVGCVVKSSTGPTFSDKDAEEGLDAVEVFDKALTPEEVADRFESAE
jgi:hypothetical protein